MNNRKGIILAGGKGSRLSPLTNATSKQLLPLYNKPLIYYPLTTLMLSGIKEYLIITTPYEQDNFKHLLGNGNQWGVSIKYEVQENPGGISQAFLIGENFINKSPVALILGDNLFYGQNLRSTLTQANLNDNGATLFAYPVKDPKRFGVVTFDKDKNAISIEEKPKIASSKYAITGLYFYDKNVVEYSKLLRPSKRGELEITDLLNMYRKKKKLSADFIGRGGAWLDTGTMDDYYKTISFVSAIENRQGLKIACLEEISLNKKWIKKNNIIKAIKFYGNCDYSKYLLKLI